jgi:glutamate racemase
VRAAVAPLWSAPGAADIDVVVLACTHFPLLLDELRAVFPAEVALVDSGAAIARRVADLVAAGAPPDTTPSHVAVITSEAQPVESPANCFAALGFARVDRFDAELSSTATVA